MELNGYRVPLIINVATLVPALIWAFTAASSIQERLAKLEGQAVQNGADRYRSGDAKRDFDWRDYEIKDLQQRVRELETRHR